MEKRPTVVRGNASEIMALASVCKIPVSSAAAGSAGGKGVDSTNSSDEAVGSAVALAQHYGCVVAVSGAVDIITDGKVKALVSNGQEMLTKITAAGCSLSALCAAYCAVSKTPLAGVVAAFVHFTVAADLAAALPEVALPQRPKCLACKHPAAAAVYQPHCTVSVWVVVEEEESNSIICLFIR